MIKTRIAMIGFGEAGRILGKGLADSGRFEVFAWDILMNDPRVRDEMWAAAVGAGVHMAENAAGALRDARVVVSAVTAASAVDVARECGPMLGSGRFFMDINSVSPGCKQGNAELVERFGAAYVDAAVMESVPPTGVRVPILLGGAQAAALKALLDPAGMNLEIVSERVGVASAIKMCRSVMIKGLEALTMECFLAARRYGVEERVIRSLDKTFPHMNWDAQGDYLMSRVVKHGRRRAAEMREAVTTLREAGLDPFMTEGTVARQQWAADLAAAGVFATTVSSPFRWRDGADAIRAGESAANDAHQAA